MISNGFVSSVQTQTALQ